MKKTAMPTNSPGSELRAQVSFWTTDLDREAATRASLHDVKETKGVRV
jgi:hypothetical protein